jgi:hypothetical protein
LANRTTLQDIGDYLGVSGGVVFKAVHKKVQVIADELIRHHLSETFFAAKLGDMDCVLANIMFIEHRLRFLEGEE